MDENDGDFGSFFVGFLIGGLAGAAVALLLAPQSGEETRTIIRDKSIELKDRAMESAEEARLRAEEMAEQARVRAEELQQKGKQAVDEQVQRIETAVEAGKKAAKEKREEMGGETPATPM